jgi:hypothetical protein
MSQTQASQSRRASHAQDLTKLERQCFPACSADATRAWRGVVSGGRRRGRVPAWDRELAEIYTTGASGHVLQSRGLGAVFGSSLYRGLPLRQLVDRYATDALISAVAREASRGRLLLVAATNLETAEPTIWDLGAIAMNGGPSAGRLWTTFGHSSTGRKSCA